MILARPVPIREWRPDLPAGDLRSISLHWTAGDYATVYPAYHFVLAGADEVVVHHTHDLRENMREVYKGPELPYAAHTRGRNSFSIGISIAGMRDATPFDFGLYPLTEAQLDAMCRLSAGLARWYGIDVAAIRTHAEAAIDDGYFGAGSDDLRWDIARLQPSPDALTADEASATGDWFRRRIADLLVPAR
ncbi:MAG TPA: N-acetylmuramoyl-L-alanine amidase [Candidatus Acidoferrum sp.]|nr:N-acetylmuramoyl-L-alanine amidase [Candidatus Acidoferrum sp.]